MIYKHRHAARDHHRYIVVTLVVQLHSRASLEPRFDASHTSTLHECERQYKIVIGA